MAECTTSLSGICASTVTVKHYAAKHTAYIMVCSPWYCIEHTILQWMLFSLKNLHIEAPPMYVLFKGQTRTKLQSCIT